MKCKFLKVVLTSIVLTLYSTANASVIDNFTSLDFLSDGDELIILDTSTCLKCLGLSVTLGNSVLDTENESLFSAFRCAITDGANDLFDNIF